MGVKRSHRDSSSPDAHSTSYSREASVDIKIVQLDADSAVSHEHAVMKCSLPPHDPLTFASIEEHDVHYHQVHMNRCSECHKNFPDQHYLHLHIAEYHDPINAAKRDQGEKTILVPAQKATRPPSASGGFKCSGDKYVQQHTMGLPTDLFQYACLLPECDRLCSTPQKRRLHCIDKHQFPREYDFVVVKDGIDRRSSMLIPPHRRRSSTLSSAGGTSGATGRKRGESSASTVGDSMDVVRDQDEEEKEEHSQGETRRYPTKLHGRGGFGQGQSPGRTVGRGSPQASVSPKSTSSAQTVDPMDSLTSSMSALKFIPHSVRMARGRGRGQVV